MLNGTIRSQIDTLWNAFWTGGISNPLEVIEQITYRKPGEILKAEIQQGMKELEGMLK